MLRLVRVFAGVYRALSRIERLAGHRNLIWLFCAWLAVALICSGVLFIAEYGENAAITSPFDAIWWGIVTLTTVGYGDVYPVTPEGRVAAAALMLLGITLFAAITGTITSFLVMADRDEAVVAVDVPGQIRELGRLVEEGLLTPDEFAAKKVELLARM